MGLLYSISCYYINDANTCMTHVVKVYDRCFYIWRVCDVNDKLAINNLRKLNKRKTKLMYDSHDNMFYFCS